MTFLWRVHPHMCPGGRDRRLQPVASRGRARARVQKLRHADVGGALRTDQPNSRRCSPGKRHDDPQILPAHQQGGAARRFTQRLDDPPRNWKISESDYTERALWDDYIKAFEDALRANSATHAPWYVIPSKPQVVPQSRGVADHGRDDGGAQNGLPPPSVDLAQMAQVSRRRQAAKSQQQESLSEGFGAPFP